MGQCGKRQGGKVVRSCVEKERIKVEALLLSGRL